MMSGQHRRRLNVTDGRAKNDMRGGGDTGFMRQVLRCGGSIRYFPSDSAPTANQTQMRNTNTCTVAQNLYSVILALLQIPLFFLLLLWYRLLCLHLQ